MESLRELGRTLLFVAGGLALVGAFFYFGGKRPFRLGRLPGDIYIHGKNSTFYFPLATCLLLSLLFSLVMWIARR